MKIPFNGNEMITDENFARHFAIIMYFINIVILVPHFIK